MVGRTSDSTAPRNAPRRLRYPQRPGGFADYRLDNMKGLSTMLTIANAINWRWNALVYWLHDAAARTNVRWLVSLSIWAYDRMTWRLPDRWQLVCGVPLAEYTLRNELELARHQARWYAEYASDLQWAMLLATADEDAGVLESVA